MKSLYFAALLAATVSPGAAAQTAAAGVRKPVVVEHYYRIKWGSAAEFKKLYERNHAPILRDLQKQGLITRIEIAEPFTHMAGGTRWDWRVTVSYPNEAMAIGTGGAMDAAFEAAFKRLYKDEKTFDAEEARRFSLLEDHWDVIVVQGAD